MKNERQFLKTITSTIYYYNRDLDIKLLGNSGKIIDRGRLPIDLLVIFRLSVTIIIDVFSVRLGDTELRSQIDASKCLGVPSEGSDGY